jgi:hypothetical protein
MAVTIRYSDESQASGGVQEVAEDVAKILTPNEEILYIAVQNATALSVVKDCVVATSNRVIFYVRKILGRVDFHDFQWQDVLHTKLEQGVLSSEFSIETTDGRTAQITHLDKDQAKRLYAVCQQLDQEWREKRRVRQMEEERARSGGIYMQNPTPAASGGDDDPVARLAKAKSMLDQELISEAEYDALKAKILSGM